ncbi:hypothetical protein IWW38_000342 [Coemansia aciculifera]|uniref:Uncharacterized protein n=1 Tax=Coemansia aciculifera TaxID=417176 RepID=A0ACC1MB51_9FUNG|nr:hypothetical protein IWW38_000342 [Coemansia aciculifera]
MSKCVENCIHNLQLAWITDDASPTDSRISQLFGHTDPIWRQTCCTKPDSIQSSKLLRGVMTAASRLLRPPADGRNSSAKDMAIMWTAELPVVAAQLCNSKDFARPGENQSNSLVLERGGSLHILLHLLDLAYRSGDIDFSAAISSVYDTAVILASDGDRLKERDHLWTALLEFGGALLSRRSQLDASEGEFAMRFALLATSVVHLAALDAQIAVLALVYTLRTRHGFDVDQLVGDLVAACISLASQREFKIETGHLVLALYGPNNSLPANLASSVYALQCDLGDSVRTVWTRVASCIDSFTVWRSNHAFAGLKSALQRDVRRKSIGLSADKALMVVPVSDAMMVVKAVVDSANSSTTKVTDVGLSKAALDIVLAISTALGRQQADPAATVFDTVDWMAGSVARSLRALALPERQLISAHLMEVIKTCLNRLKSSDGRLQAVSAAPGGLYWVLVLISQLCMPNGADCLGLLADSDHQLLLVKAAVVSSNIAFGLFALQTVLGNYRALGSSSGIDGNLRRLLSAAPWATISRMLGDEAGDAVELLLRLRTNEVDDVQDALYAIKLDDVGAAGASLDMFDEDDDTVHRGLTLLELEGVCQVAENRALAVYVENNATMLSIADNLLDRVVCRTLCRMPSAVRWKSFGGMVRRPLRSTEAIAQAVEFATATEAIDHSRATSLLLAAVCEGPLDSRRVLEHWQLYVANKIAGSFMVPHLVASEAEALATRLFASNVVDAAAGAISANDRVDICFAQRLPATGHAIQVDPIVRLFVGGLETDHSWMLPESLDALAARGVDTTKAREAMLYVSSWSGPSCNATDALYTHLLMEASGRIRFTASGTFDPAARLISHMTTSPSSAPTLVTDSLSKNAVRQLAPYIPQLFSMLCYNKPDASAVDNSRGTASDSALTILELLATSAPELVLFHAVVACKSLPDASNGGERAAKLLKLFEAQQVADVYAFLDMASSVASPAKDQMRYLCLKAKVAFERVVDAFVEGKFADMPRREKEAFEAPLKPVVKFLKEHASTKVARSQAEAEFHSNVSFFLLVLKSLASCSESLPGDNGEQMRVLVKGGWSSIFSRIDSENTMPVSYYCPRFSEFVSAVPIPVLTDPTEPLYFQGVSDTLRIIKSKTSPKLLSFKLGSRDGAVAVKQYIIKGNEDMRIDECVMQVFTRLNRVIGADSAAEESSTTRLAVYNVVPIDVNGGLIEVVENAPTLFHLVAQGTGNFGKYGSIASLYMRHAQPALKAAGLPDNEPFSSWPDKVCRCAFDSLLQQSPAPILHRHLMRTSQSPSGLHLATKNMVRSIAMASMAGYVVGLGDRHLGNLLVCAQSGQLVNIDFSLSFDSGSSSIIPEQVPFRLTPILEYLCGSPPADALTEAVAAVVRRPYALTRVFERAARATLMFARMDRHTLVAAIARRVQFRPFCEWMCMEESWLRDRVAGGGTERTKGEMNMSMPRRMPLAAAEMWSQASGAARSTTEDFVRGTGLCPANGFWPQQDLAADKSLSVTEMPLGWRIAQGAVSRMDARLDYQGVTEIGPDGKSLRSKADLVKEQFATAWDAATCKDRLSRMFIGWGSWI